MVLGFHVVLMFDSPLRCRDAPIVSRTSGPRRFGSGLPSLPEVLSTSMIVVGPEIPEGSAPSLLKLALQCALLAGALAPIWF